MAALEGGVAKPLAGVLAAQRDNLNNRIAVLRRGRPRLTDEVLYFHFHLFLSPLAEALAARTLSSEKVLEPLVTLSLELLARGVLDGSGDGPMARAWLTALPPAACLKENPRGTAAALTNGLHSLSRIVGARVEPWIDRMGRAGAHCSTLEIFRRAGLAAAWRSGVASAREAAVKALAEFPEDLKRSIMGDFNGPVDWSVFARDPWAPLPGEPRRLRLVGSVGGFRGLDGPFKAPPEAGQNDEGLLLRDDDRVWRVDADLFGLTLRSTPGVEFHLNRGGDFRAKNGKIIDAEGTAPWPLGVPPLSQAAAGGTLLVASAFSHRGFVFARAGDSHAD